jgi:hypothetical protein
MKRLLLFFAVVTMLASCNTDTTTVVNLTTSAQDWNIYSVPDNDIPLYYACTFAMPEINSTVYEQGLVQVSIVFNGAQQVLPYVQHYETKDGIEWTRTIDFRYATGELTIFVTNSDFIVDPPVAMDFRVVIIQ